MVIQNPGILKNEFELVQYTSSHPSAIKNIDEYYPDKALIMIINQPIEVAKKSDKDDLLSL